MKCAMCLQGCGKKQLRFWLPSACTPWQAKDALFIPLPLGFATLPDWPLNKFDSEDGEIKYEDDEPQNDAWQAVFNIGDEVQKSAKNPRLGAMSVHEEHGIFPPQGRHGLRQMWGYSMWVNRKVRRDCPGSSSKLGMEVLKRMANRETPRAGKSGLSPSTWRRQPGWLWRVLERDPCHLVPCPTPCGAVGGWTRAGFGSGRTGRFPLWERTCPCARRVCFKSFFVFFLQFMFELPSSSARSAQCAQRWARIRGIPRCLNQKSATQKSPIFSFSSFFLLFFLFFFPFFFSFSFFFFLFTFLLSFVLPFFIFFFIHFSLSTFSHFLPFLFPDGSSGGPKSPHSESTGGHGICLQNPAGPFFFDIFLHTVCLRVARHLPARSVHLPAKSGVDFFHFLFFYTFFNFLLSQNRKLLTPRHSPPNRDHPTHPPNPTPDAQPNTPSLRASGVIILPGSPQDAKA